MSLVQALNIPQTPPDDAAEQHIYLLPVKTACDVTVSGAGVASDSAR